VLLKKEENIPISASLATIIVERVFDGVVMLGFVFVNLPELARLTHTSGFVGDIRSLAIIGAGVFLGALLVFLFLAVQPQRSMAIIHRIAGRLPEGYAEKIVGLSDRFLGGLASLRSPSSILMVFVTSVVIWLLETAKYWFVMHAFPFEVSFFALMLMNGIVNLATTIPSAPGYVGTFDAPGIAVLQAYGVEKAMAAAYTFVLHIALWAPITALGGYYMLRKGLHWSDELKAARAEV
jgi:uncharacterized protein (TIRG00374 family)